MAGGTSIWVSAPGLKGVKGRVRVSDRQAWLNFSRRVLSLCSERPVGLPKSSSSPCAGQATWLGLSFLICTLPSKKGGRERPGGLEGVGLAMEPGTAARQADQGLDQQSHRTTGVRALRALHGQEWWHKLIPHRGTTLGQGPPALRQDTLPFA